MKTARLGVLVPSGNPTMEPELYRMKPPSLTIHFARLDAPGSDPGATAGMEHRTLGYLDALPAAVQSMAALKLDALALGHTAVSYLTGFDKEPAVIERLTALAGPRAFPVARAVGAALRHLGVQKLALATPYPDAISSAGLRYWRAAGFDVVAHHILDGVANIYEETEERAYALGRAVDSAAADAVLISGTGLPTVGVVERLERDLGKPVVTSQAALLWHALRLIGLREPVQGYGRLLAGC